MTTTTSANNNNNNTPENILFEETFTLTALNSAKYDRAQRLSATNTLTGGDYSLELDINNELFPVAVGDTLVVALASTLALGGGGGGAASSGLGTSLPLGGGDGARDGGTTGKEGGKDDTKLWRDIARGKASLADMYAYVCYGKVYRFEESENVENL